MTTSVIFARNHSNIIGVDQKLPWDIAEDMTWFKMNTAGQTVIMGRKTFESMGGKGLPNRTNIIVSKTLPFDDELYVKRVTAVATSIEEALGIAAPDRDKLIIGGAGLIKEAIPLVDRIMMTTVNKPVDGRGKEITKLDISGLDGYYKEYMDVDGVPFKLVRDSNGYLNDRMTNEAVGVYFTVHERVRS